VAVKLRKPSETPAENGHNGDLPESIPLKPLVITGVVVTKSALIEALRPYIFGILDIESVEDGQRFVLTIGPGPEGEGRIPPTP
jgi:hypothetical protein